MERIHNEMMCEVFKLWDHEQGDTHQGLLGPTNNCAVHHLANFIKDKDVAAKCGMEQAEQTNEKGQILTTVKHVLVLLTRKLVVLNIWKYLESHVEPPLRRQHLEIGIHSIDHQTAGALLIS